jgi:hypothetical protein
MSTTDAIRRVARAAGPRTSRALRVGGVVLAGVAVVAAVAVAASALRTAPPRLSQSPSGGGHGVMAIGLGRSAPVRIVIPSIGVEAQIVPLGLAGGELAAPPDGSRAGWYERGTSPGELGSAVIVGRAVPERPRGPAIFARLDRLAAGDPIQVVREDGAIATFAVDRVERFTTERAHQDTGAEAQLRLVSRDLVVWATLAP